ncbi:MAG: hypothetical protein K2N68_01240, partial [Clostridia bacterium]|nr:hypothetical protein [Clostridia bacterium]
MKVFKSNKKSVFVTFLVTVFFCAIFAFTGIFTQNKQDFAAEAKVNGTAIDLGTGGFSGNTTAKNNLPSLYAKLTGSTTATYSALETAFASSGTGTILKNATQINADVKMGGQTWNVVALTKTSSGLVATLWLADSNEKYKWNDWYENNTTYAYPSSMYSSSKIRSRLVGTKYVSTKGATTLAGASVQNTTWSTLITQYGSQIVAPSAVAWQGTEAANGSAASGGVNWTYNNPNDAWGTPRVQNWYSSGSVVIKDITTKSGYNGWSADKLWLPSITETGYNDSYPGLWHTSATQRANSSGTYCWLRSGTCRNDSSAYTLYADGSDYLSSSVTYEYAVR